MPLLLPSPNIGNDLVDATRNERQRLMLGGQTLTNQLGRTIREVRQRKASIAVNDAIIAFEKGKQEDVDASLKTLRAIDPEKEGQVRNHLYIRTRFNNKELAKMNQQTREQVGQLYDKDSAVFRDNVNRLAPLFMKEAGLQYGDRAQDVVQQYHDMITTVNTPGMLDSAHKTAGAYYKMYYPEREKEEYTRKRNEDQDRIAEEKQKWQVDKDIREEARAEERLAQGWVRAGQAGTRNEKSQVDLENKIVDQALQLLPKEVKGTKESREYAFKVVQMFREHGDQARAIKEAGQEVWPETKQEEGFWSRLWDSVKGKASSVGKSEKNVSDFYE